METIFEYVKGISSVLALLSFFIEFTPIKAKPLSFLFKNLGKSLNSEVNVKIDNLANDFSNYKMSQEDRIRKELRKRISDFAQDIKHGVVKSETQYIAIIDDCDEYLNNHWNSGAELDAQFIKDTFNEMRSKIYNHQIYERK